MYSDLELTTLQACLTYLFVNLPGCIWSEGTIIVTEASKTAASCPGANILIPSCSYVVNLQPARHSILSIQVLDKSRLISWLGRQYYQLGPQTDHPIYTCSECSKQLGALIVILPQMQVRNSCLARIELAAATVCC